MRGQTIQERIVSMISVSSAGCWLWQSSFYKTGYGAASAT